MMGNYHARCGAGEKPEVETPEAYLSLFSLPDDFDKILSVMRSREVSVSIILQNLAQLKALFEKQWESIMGNADEPPLTPTPMESLPDTPGTIPRTIRSRAGS